MAGLAASFGSGAATNPLAEIAKADCIFIIGSNTSAQHPLAYAQVVKAVQNGATLMVADPRKIPVAELANHYLPIPPGTNLVLINALLNVIIAEKLYDDNFIKERTEGFAQMAESVKHCTPHWASKITGLDESDIYTMAKAYAKAKNAMILYCMGVTQHVTSTETCRALANLAMLCGMIGRPSTGLLPLRGQNNVQGSCDMGALPETLPGYVQAGSDLAWQRFYPHWGNFANTQGMKLTEMIEAMHTGRIKSLYIMGENPLLSDADTSVTKEALSNLDFLVVQDLFMTETAQLAHVVLPASSYLEKDGTFTNTDRRVQRIRKALPTYADSQPDWQILLDLIKRLDHEQAYSQDLNTPQEIFDEMTSLVPSYSGMTYERLEKEQGLCWPCLKQDNGDLHPGTPILHQDSFTRGKGLFMVNNFEIRGQQASTEYPFILVTGRLAHHYHTGTMTRRSWALEREAPAAFLEMHPDDAKSIGVKDMWYVRVRSPYGSVRVLVHVTSAISRGHVFLPFHFVESAANELTSHKHLDPFVKIPEFKVSAVSIVEA